jgi:hypothetical protein
VAVFAVQGFGRIKLWVWQRSAGEKSMAIVSTRKIVKGQCAMDVKPRRSEKGA